MTSKTKNNPMTVLAEAQALVKQRHSQQTSAIAAEAALDARLYRGDDRVTTTDLTDAAANIRRATALLRAAREDLSLAEASASLAEAKASPDVARAVADLLTEHSMTLGLYGFPIELVEQVPTAPAAVPSIYVTQVEATTHDGLTGTASGTAQVYLFGDVSLVEKLGSIREGLRNLGHALRLASFDCGGIPSRDLGQGLWRYGMSIAATNLVPELPSIAREVEPWRLASVAPLLHAEVVQTAGLYRTAGVGVGAGDSGALQSRVNCVTRDQRFVGTESGSDGLARRTVDVTLAASTRAVTAEELQSDISLAVERMVGRFVTGVGRIESARLTNVKPITHGREVIVRLVLVSRPI